MVHDVWSSVLGKEFAGGRVFSRGRSRQTVPVPATETHVGRFTGTPEESRIRRETNHFKVTHKKLETTKGKSNAKGMSV